LKFQGRLRAAFFVAKILAARNISGGLVFKLLNGYQCYETNCSPAGWDCQRFVGCGFDGLGLDRR
jgi:hypothetical protein